MGGHVLPAGLTWPVGGAAAASAARRPAGRASARSSLASRRTRCAGAAPAGPLSDALRLARHVPARQRRRRRHRRERGRRAAGSRARATDERKREAGRRRLRRGARGRRARPEERSGRRCMATTPTRQHTPRFRETQPRFLLGPKVYGDHTPYTTVSQNPTPVLAQGVWRPYRLYTIHHGFAKPNPGTT